VDTVRPLEQAGEPPAPTGEAGSPPPPQKLFLRLPSGEDPRWRKIQLILELFPGQGAIRAKFMDTQRWTPPAPCLVHPLLVKELQEMLGEENVVIK